MKSCILLACLAFALGAIAAPAAVAADASSEEAGDPCCATGCTLCLCCSHQPEMLAGSWRAEAGAASPRAAEESLAAPLSPDPRDISHVPRSAASC